LKRDPSVTNIYFLVADELNLVKIGRTNDVKKRVDFINTSSPVELELVSVLRGVDPVQEQLIHEKFKAMRQRGEWFHLSDELRAFVANPTTIEVDPENNWSTCKVFISWYDNTIDAREDAIWLEESISKVYKCTDILTGDPEWNYMSAAKCVLWSRIEPDKIKLLQSNPSDWDKLPQHKPFTIQECPTKEQAKLALVPYDVLTQWLSDKESESIALGEIGRRSQVKADYPCIEHYAEIHVRERSQLWALICTQEERANKGAEEVNG